MTNTNRTKLLQYVDSEFTVSHIMTRKESMVFFSEEEKERGHFSFLPIDNTFDSFWSRHEEKIKRVERGDIISSSTPLSVLIGYFKDREFFFVNDGNEIVGAVHYSDLKKHAVRVLFYILVTDIELAFLEMYSTREDFIRETLSKDKLDKIQSWIDVDKQYSENISLVEYLNLSDFLFVASKDEKFLEKCGLSRNKWSEFGSIVDIRHWVAHPVKGEMKGRDVRDFLFGNQQRIMNLLDILSRIR